MSPIPRFSHLTPADYQECCNLVQATSKVHNLFLQIQNSTFYLFASSSNRQETLKLLGLFVRQTDSSYDLKSIAEKIPQLTKSEKQALVQIYPHFTHTTFPQRCYLINFFSSHLDTITTFQSLLFPDAPYQDKLKLIETLRDKTAILEFLYNQYKTIFQALPLQYVAFDRQQAILPQLLEFLAVSHFRFKGAFLGEDGVDAGGIANEVVQKASLDLVERFSSILKKNESGLFELKTSDNPSDEEMKDASLLGKMLFFMLACGVKLPKDLVFSPQFYQDLTSFPQRFLSSEEPLQENDFYALYPQVQNEEEVFGTDDQEELASERKKAVARKVLSCQIAKQVSSFGKIKPHSYIQSLLAPVNIRENILAQMFFSSYSEGDVDRLTKFFNSWIKETSAQNLQDFLFISTGLYALPPATKLCIQARRPEAGSIISMHAHTCSSLLKFPAIPSRRTLYKTYWGTANFRNYKEWKQWLEAMLPLMQGFGRM